MPSLTANGAVTANFKVTNPSNAMVIGGTARIDTGADVSVIDASIASSISAAPIGYIQLVGVDGVPQNTQVYVVDLDLGDLGYASGVKVTGDSALYSATGYSCLVGVDILSSGILVYDGPTQNYQMSIGISKAPAIGRAVPQWAAYLGAGLLVAGGITATVLALRR